MNKKSEKYNSSVPEFSIIIDDGLGFTIKIYGCFIPPDSEIYLSFKRSVQRNSQINIVRETISYEICEGMTGVDDYSNTICK